MAQRGQPELLAGRGADDNFNWPARPRRGIERQNGGLSGNLPQHGRAQGKASPD
jgi:hypothetical protein